jgi:hypothetical protein
MQAHEARPRQLVVAVGHQLRNGSARVRNNDRLAAPHSTQEVREDVPGIVRVVLRQRRWRCWLGHAALAAVAEPAEPPDRHDVNLTG